MATATIVRRFKQEYSDGNCKIEQKWSRDGEYKKEIKCKGGRSPYAAQGYPPGHGYGRP